MTTEKMLKTYSSELDNKRVRETTISNNFTADDSIWNDPKVLRSKAVKSIVTKIYLDQFRDETQDPEQDSFAELMHHYTTSELIGYLYDANIADALDTPELNRAVEKALSTKNFYGEARMNSRNLRESITGNPEDYDEWGFDDEGFDAEGFDEEGFDEYGYDSDGYDSDGFDVNDESRWDKEDSGPFNESVNMSDFSNVDADDWDVVPQDLDELEYITYEDEEDFEDDFEDEDEWEVNEQNEYINMRDLEDTGFDSDGYDLAGYNAEGYDRAGYHIDDADIDRIEDEYYNDIEGLEDYDN